MLTPAPLLLLAFALHAQDNSTILLGRDHAQFARELYQAGYVELAENLCTRIENDPEAEPSEVASVRSVHLDLKIAQAKTQKDKGAKLAALTQLLKAKEEFIDAYPDSPEAIAAQQTLPDVYASVGEAYSDALLDAKDDPGEAKRLRSEGSDIFRRGEAALAEQVEALTEQANDTTTLSQVEIDALDQQLMTAMYNQARTFFFHATLLGKDDPFGKTFLERSIEAFGLFSLSYGDTLLNYEGQVFQGWANEWLGLTDDALLAYDECISLKDTYGPNEAMADATIQVIAWGAQKKIELLVQLKRYDEAIATADDFLKTVKGASATQQDLVVLLARMEAEIASGNAAASQKTAQLLVDKQPNGYFGNRGREILGNLVASGSGVVDQKNLLKIAQSMAAKKDYEQAITLCNQAVAASRATGKPSDDITDAFLVAAACNWYLDRLEEASVAYDSAYESNPKAAKAGDALYSASTAYEKLYKLTKRPFFEKRAEERLHRLATEFPKHPHAEEQVLSEAKKLLGDDKFAEAAASYLRVAVGSSAYAEAQYGAATSLYSETVRLSKEKSPELKAAATKAEEQLRKAQTVLAAAAGKTLDLAEQASLGDKSVQCMSLIGSLYMLEGVGKQNDVLALTKEMEEKYAGDEEKIGEARSLRVRALTALGKVKEAEDFLEGLLAADPDSRSTALAAGQLARTFDTQAAELFAKEKNSSAGEELWKQAFRYYVVSVKPKLESGGSGNEIEQVALRLMVMGEHFNSVPEGVRSFVGLKDRKAPVAPEYWEEAVTLYESAVAKSGSFESRVGLSRTLGYLGRFKEAVDVYAQIIENETFIDPATSEINRSALTGRPELMDIYLELGVSRFEAGRTEKDDGQVENASAIFAQIVKALPKYSSKAWWLARYYQIESWYEIGRYPQCLAAINDLERNSNDFDEGKYGLNVRFKELKRKVEGKI